MSTQETYVASEIRILDSREAVRRRPTMYIPDTDLVGLHSLIIGLIMHAEVEVKEGHGETISIRLHEDDSCTVMHDGAGLPVDLTEEDGGPSIDAFFTRFNSGSHREHLMVTNALSEWLEVENYTRGLIWTQRYERGLPIGELAVRDSTSKQGTKIRFKPDPAIFRDTFRVQILARTIEKIQPLRDVANIDLKGDRAAGTEMLCILFDDAEIHIEFDRELARSHEDKTHDEILKELAPILAIVLKEGDPCGTSPAGLPIYRVHLAQA